MYTCKEINLKKNEDNAHRIREKMMKNAKKIKKKKNKKSHKKYQKWCWNGECNEKNDAETIAQNNENPEKNTL